MSEYNIFKNTLFSPTDFIIIQNTVHENMFPKWFAGELLINNFPHLLWILEVHVAIRS